MITRTLTVLLGLAMLTACGSAPADQSSAQSAATPAAECVKAPAAFLAELASGGKQEIRPVDGFVVQSPENPAARVVAMSFTGPDVGQGQGVWVHVGSELGSGITMSVDDTAQIVTEWPASQATKFNIGENFGGVQEARDCLSR